MLEKTKAFCDTFLDAGLPGFDLAVYRGGECILRHYNGYRDLERKLPMTGEERYNIYSCSKVITCVAAAQLLERGLFTLEDKLCDYMPEFSVMTVLTNGGVKRAEKPILIRHLFEMTAGFSYDCESPSLKQGYVETEGRCPTREMMKYLAKEPLLFEPGERWEYSLCHDVLAALVEVISGEKFESYVKKNIFDVAKMTRSTFMLPSDELAEITEQYMGIDGVTTNIGRPIHRYKLGSEYASGGAGCISTVDDYIKFLEALRTHKLLKPETLELMITDRLTDEQKRTFWNKNHYGYGLGVKCPDKRHLHPDFGWGGAACATLSVDPENEISIYFGAHMISCPAAGLRHMVHRFVHAELFNESEFAEIKAELATLHNYNLTY